MEVIVMYRNNWFSGDGWTYYPKTIEISDNCPVCGEKRGKPKYYRFHEDGQWFTVNTWKNPCGHTDYYKQCLEEANRIKGAYKMKLRKR